VEAHSIQATGAPEAAGAGDATARPRAKDGGVAAGIAAVIREIESLFSNAGGLVVVAIGVAAVMIITTASIGTVAEGEQATVATAAFSVLGTIVGAYFGVRVGARGKDEAEAARDVAAAKVERLAAHVNGNEAEKVLNAVNKAAQEDALRR
jgi:hypothetical protein